jgi:hypothetical protein
MRHLLGKGKWNMCAGLTTYIYDIEDLGRGADRWCIWLTCMYPHDVCMLKFPNYKDITAGELFKQERDNWHHQVYPELKTKVACKWWCGQEVLWMPHLGPISMLSEVHQVLAEFFDSASPWWCGLVASNSKVCRKDGDTQAVVFNLGQVQRKDAKDGNFVETMIKNLSNKSAGVGHGHVPTR